MSPGFEDDDSGRARAPRSVAVELLVQVAPALPQPFTILAHSSPPEHVPPDSTGQLDDRLRVGLLYDRDGKVSHADEATKKRRSMTCTLPRSDLKQTRHLRWRVRSYDFPNKDLAPSRGWYRH